MAWHTMVALTVSNFVKEIKPSECRSSGQVVVEGRWVRN